MIVGDPHFADFDGKHGMIVAGNENNAKYLNHFTLVKTPNVTIQGMARGKQSWSAGVAISGPFIGNSVLVAYNSRDAKNELGVVTWNGKQVLKKDGVTRPARNVELMRKHGSEFFSGKKVEKAFGGRREWMHLETSSHKGAKLDAIKQRWAQGSVYRFRLPGYIDVFVKFEKSKPNPHRAPSPGGSANSVPINDIPPGAEVYIKMPHSKYKDAVGYCRSRAHNNKIMAAGGSIPWRPKDDDVVGDLFEKAGLGGPTLMELASHSSWKGMPRNKTGNPCDQSDEVHAKAVFQCGHIQAAQIREDCIYDACSSGNIDMAVEAADDAVLMSGMIGAMSATEDKDDNCNCP